jgi:hypothetical protein
MSLTFHTILYPLFSRLPLYYWYMAQAAWELHSCIIRLQSVHHRPVLANHLGWKHTVFRPTHASKRSYMQNAVKRAISTRQQGNTHRLKSLPKNDTWLLPNPLSGKQPHSPCELTIGNCTLLGLTSALIAFLRKEDMADLYGGFYVEHKC